MHTFILNSFRDLICQHTGLVVPESDDALLLDKLSKRMQVLQILKPELYLSVLARDEYQSQDEWRKLVLDLTTGESYFFRDRGQISLLQNTILPKLLHLNEDRRVLRIWSAGCSTGEEPYSLAILVQQLLPQIHDWNIVIMGTDINENALEQAQQGRYGRWAFRGVKEDILNRYFSHTMGEWLLNASVRNMVTFEKLNLIKDRFPDSSRSLDTFDLIVCRNVFIYFNNPAIAGVVAKFAATLRSGGFLITGHAEIQHPISKMIDSGTIPLITRHFPDSVIYQRSFDEPPPAHIPKFYTAPPLRSSRSGIDLGSKSKLSKRPPSTVLRTIPPPISLYFTREPFPLF